MSSVALVEHLIWRLGAFMSSAESVNLQQPAANVCIRRRPLTIGFCRRTRCRRASTFATTRRRLDSDYWRLQDECKSVRPAAR